MVIVLSIRMGSALDILGDCRGACFAGFSRIFGLRPGNESALDSSVDETGKIEDTINSFSGSWGLT